LRRLWILLSNLPTQSRLYADLYNDGHEIWSLEAHLIDDCRMALTGSEKHPAKPHPARFVKSAIRSGWGDPSRVKKLVNAVRRARRRRAALHASKEG
jgi:hypothetical protein